MEPSVVVMFRPRNPGDAFEIWHVAPRPDGAAQVIVEREFAVHAGPNTLGRPFGATLARVARLVEDEADRVITGAQQTIQRLRKLADGLVA